MNSKDEQAIAVATEAVTKLGDTLGIELNPALVLFLAGRVVEVVVGSAWREAQAAGKAAADAIKTADDAEVVMRGEK
jgi:hypothetical protein